MAKFKKVSAQGKRDAGWLSRASWGRILFAGAVAFVSALMFEGLLEYYDLYQERRVDATQGHRPYYWWSFHTRSGERLKENFPGAPHEGILKLQLDPAMVYKNMPNQKTAYFSTDGAGLRGTKPSPEGSFRTIVLLGGSTAFGTGLDSDEQTFARQLEIVLPETHVLNAAVIGHESGQELVYLLTEFVDRHPALVMTLDGFNDFMESYQPDFDEMPHGFANFNVIDDQIAAAEKQFSRPLLERLLNLDKILFPRLEEKLKQGEATTDRVLRGEKIKKNILVAARQYASNVSKMAGIACYGGARFLCVIQPLRVSNDFPSKHVAALYGKFIGIASKELRQRKIAVMNLNSSKYDKHLKPSVFMDGVHLDYRGNVMMARLVADRIRELRLLGREDGNGKSWLGASCAQWRTLSRRLK